MASYANRWQRLYPNTPPPRRDEFDDLINKGYVALDPATGQFSLTKEGWAALDEVDE